MKYIRLFFLLTILSCSSDNEPMNEWESQMSEMLQAQRVKLYHQSLSRKENDRLIASEEYLSFDIQNSKVLSDIKHNERLLNEKCQLLADYILAIPTLSELPDFNELRININETRGFSIFQTNTTKTITYKNIK